MEENKKVCLLIAIGSPLFLVSQVIGNEIISASSVLMGVTLNATALVLALKNHKRQKTDQLTT